MISVETTGIEDREGPWKLAVCGFAGVGKTMFASTAPAPLFVFFGENPRLKSVASRRIPHVKLVNDPDGATVQEKVQALVMSLELTKHGYQTLVVDTGDELFQAMKQGRMFRNGGEFSVGDWSWIADAYRELIASIIDLPLDVVVLYHIKSVQEEEGRTARELMLQGSSKDEAPSWFDIVGVIDTHDVVNEDGITITKRALVTQGGRLYPWVKDHSGVLPRRYEISEAFIDDLRILLDLVRSDPQGSASHEIIETIPLPDERPITGIPVPTPEQLKAKKENVISPILTDTAPEGAGSGSEKQEIANPPVPSEEDSIDSPATLVEEQVESTEADELTSSGSEEDTVALVKSELGAVEVVTCADCGAEIDDPDLQELTQIRFRANLCRDDFKKRNAAKK